MKKNIFLTIIFSVVSLLVLGQCPNYTHTDPNPSYVLPTSGGFKTNTFDWTGTNNSTHTIPINKPTPITSTSVHSPFFETADAWMAGIVTNAATDSKPEDGWELIKQDMGYYYDGSASLKWEGHDFASSAYENNSAAYIVLYNKYQAKLRVFAILPTQGSTTADVTNVTLSFVPHTPDVHNSALFNTYNVIQEPLDQKTQIRSISAMAIQPNTADRWIYADSQ